MPWFWLTPLLLLCAAAGVWFWRVGKAARPTERWRLARQAFDARRAELQAQFFATAAASGKPRGLRWKECQWDDALAAICEKNTGQLLALVGVTIAFEAVEGGDMEGLAAVGNLRNATAVFFLHEGEWRTSGRAVFNLNPDEAAAHFGQQYERIG
jgi:hypothetical protein